MRLGRALAVGAFLISLWVFVGGVVNDSDFAGGPAPTPVVSSLQPLPSASAGSASPSPTVKVPVLMAQPLSISIPSINYSSNTPKLTIGDSGAIDPTDFTHTFWITDRGSKPGEDAYNTTYFACHTFSTRTSAEVPCNGLPGAVRAGAEIVVTTGNGQLTYLVTQEPRKVLRSDFANDNDVWAVSPGRLVWVTCYITANQRTSYNYVLIAELRK